MRFLSLYFILCYITFSSQKSTPADDTYIAAVVEYNSDRNTTTNLDNYIDHIYEAAAQNADIVVFPEMTLTVGASIAVPIYGSLMEYPIPALNPELYDEILVSISEAARLNEIYVVINVQEILNCADSSTDGENCPEKKRYLFNTNVVFDRTGAVVDRYRKINLFGEFTRTPALTPDLGVFDTDFGVTFGHFICFDLMFQVPATQIVENWNITDVVFTTMWFSELPYLTAVQIQQAYAYSMNVNFLAAGANNPRVGSAGSGIYSGKAGALVSIMPRSPTTRLLVAVVPKVPGEVTGRIQGPIYDNPSNQDNLKLIFDPSLISHQTRLLAEDTRALTVTDKDVTCQFRIRMRQQNENTTYRYRVSAFSGVRSFSGMANGGVRICSLFACTGVTIDTCGQRFENSTDTATAIFDRLEVTAVFPTPTEDSDIGAKRAAYFPVSLTTSMMPLKNEEIAVENISLFGQTLLSVRLRQAKEGIYSFGIWGREYTTDDQDASPPVEHEVPTSTTTATPTTPGGSGAVTHQISLILLFLSISILLRYI